MDSDTDFMKLQEIWQLYIEYNTTQAPRYTNEPPKSHITIHSLRTLLKTMSRTYKVSSEGTSDNVSFSCVTRDSQLPSSRREDDLQCNIQMKAARVIDRMQESCHVLADLYQFHNIDEQIDDYTEIQSSHESCATSEVDSELRSHSDSESSFTVDERDEDYPFNLSPSAPKWVMKYMRDKELYNTLTVYNSHYFSIHNIHNILPNFFHSGHYHYHCLSQN